MSEHFHQGLKWDCASIDTRLRHLEAQNRRYREALEEISLGKGAYSQDQFEHCQNTVRDMKELAQSALEEGKDDSD